MKVAFSVGERSLEIIQKLKSTLDNVDFYTYSSVEEMVRESNMRRLYFDRIILSEIILSDSKKDLSALNSYISNYSNSTSIVLLCKKGNLNNERLFTEMFNSPLYTPVLADKTSIVMLSSLVVDDIASIRAKFYSLDIKEAETLTVKYEAEAKKVVEPVVEKVEKKGFLSRLFRKMENASKEPELISTPPVVSKVVPKMPDVVPNIPKDIGAPNMSFDGSGGSNISSNRGTSKNERDAIPQENRIAPSSLGVENVGGQISNMDIGELDLGLGDLGDSHPDTGFLDDDEFDSLSKELESSGYLKEAKSNGVMSSQLLADEVNDMLEDDMGTNEEITTGNLDVEPSPVIPESEKEDLSFTSIEGLVFPDTNKLRVLIGDNCSSIVTTLAKSYKAKGLRVLIVSLENRNLDILEGFGTLRVLENSEDTKIGGLQKFVSGDIDLLYPAFGSGVSDSDIESLDMIYFFDAYDCVIIDCPFDFIDCISNSILKKSSVIVNGGKEVSKVILALSSLTGKLSSSEREDLLYDLANISFSGTSEELEFLEKRCLFSRGNWLLKIQK